MPSLRALLGVAALCALAWLFSEDRWRVRWRLIFSGLALQVGLAWFVLRTDLGVEVFERAGALFSTLIGMTDHGVRMVFGSLADPSGPWVFVFAFKGTRPADPSGRDALRGLTYLARSAPRRRPRPGRERCDLRGFRRRQPAQHVLDVPLGVDAGLLARKDQ